MNLKVFSPLEVEMMADVLLKQGLHPRKVRTQLAKEGIHWGYEYLGQGRRERLRRLKKQGKDLCGCGQAKIRTVSLCDACLQKKWGPQ